MATRTYQQYFAIEKRLKAMPGSNIERSELIEDFTHGKKNSLRDLTASEYREFVASLQRLINKKQPKKTDWRTSPANLMRRKIIGLCYKIGWVNESKPDMKKIHAWVLKYGYLHKPMNDYTVSELPKLVTQAENMYKHNLTTYK